MPVYVPTASVRFATHGAVPLTSFWYQSLSVLSQLPIVVSPPWSAVASVPGHSSRNSPKSVCTSCAVSQALLAFVFAPSAWPLMAGKSLSGYLSCLLYTSDAADERSSVDLGGRRII